MLQAGTLSTVNYGRKMDRERQTFELLQLLGDDVAEVVLSRLPPERAAMLRSGMQSDKARRSTIGRQRAVLDDFDCFFQFAIKSLPKESHEDIEIANTGFGSSSAIVAESSDVSPDKNSGDDADNSISETSETSPVEAPKLT